MNDCINGTLMHKNTPIAVVANSQITSIFFQNLLPLPFIFGCNNVTGWLNGKAIDDSRVNSRLLKKLFRFTEKDNISTVMKMNAVTITDNYWIRTDENQKYSDVDFSNDIFSDMALKGDTTLLLNYNDVSDKRTPEFTNIGSLEKCWKLINKEWFLYKSESNEEMFSEMATYLIGKALNFDIAEYELDDKYIRTKDFTQHKLFDYEPISSVVGENEDYEFNFSKLKEIDAKYHTTLAEEYVKILVLDVICFNYDRHTENYGVLRESESGAIIKMAPNFDNNLSLITKGSYSSLSSCNDILSLDFSELVRTHNLTLSLPRIPKSTFDEIRNIAKQLSIPVDVSEYAISSIKMRYENVKSCFKKTLK